MDAPASNQWIHCGGHHWSTIAVGCIELAAATTTISKASSRTHSKPCSLTGDPTLFKVVNLQLGNPCNIQ